MILSGLTPLNTHYNWILFDADETLFSFDAFSGLTLLFSQYGITFTEADFQSYMTLNKSLWVDYQNKVIDANTLQINRFVPWGNKLNIDPLTLNRGFLSAMAEVCQPLDGAIALLTALNKTAKIGIITNGFTALQQIRLQKTGINKLIDLLVISEQVGYPKPDHRIFDFAFKKMGNPEKSRVLMVGDNLDTDIKGGNDFGIDTCWYNPEMHENKTDISPKIEVDSHQKLQSLLDIS
ncbi:MAG: pyrimidine 5'-nucleotidase [Parashewanella sp.]